MAEHMKKSQTELNELLTEYWRLRHETGMLSQIQILSYISPELSDIYMETLANKLGMQVTSS